jgi:uncharacterized protein YcfJ
MLKLFSSLRRAGRSGLALVLCFALVLPGCTNPNMANVADDPSDTCRSERALLRSTGDYFTQDIIAGAAVGAVTGGLIGGLASGNLRGAAFGALAGGALGALGGYWRARQQQYASDQALLYQTVYTDIERDNGYIDRTQTAFNRLVTCRRGQAAAIRADLRYGRIGRDQARTAMAAVRAWSADDLVLARSISQHIQQRSNDFSYANQQVEGGGGASTPTPAPRMSAARTNSVARQVQAATSTNVAKRDQFEQAISRAQADQSTFELAPA